MRDLVPDNSARHITSASCVAAHRIVQDSWEADPVHVNGCSYALLKHALGHFQPPTMAAAGAPRSPYRSTARSTGKPPSVVAAGASSALPPS